MVCPLLSHLSHSGQACSHLISLLSSPPPFAYLYCQLYSSVHQAAFLFCINHLLHSLNFKRQSRGLRHWTLCWDIKFVYLKPPVQGRKSGSVALVPVDSVPTETLLHTHCLQGQATYCKGIPSPQESLKSMLIGYLPPDPAYGTVTQRRCQISQKTSN